MFNQELSSVRLHAGMPGHVEHNFFYSILRPINHLLFEVACEISALLNQIHFFCHVTIVFVSQQLEPLYTVQNHLLLLETRYSLETLQVYITTKSSINSGDL